MIETGISFADIHSFYDLDLILSAVDISPAKPKTTYVDIPGADGSIDLTEALGDVRFSDRTHKFTLTMNPMGDLSESAWEAKKTALCNALNGRACRITLDKDPDYYWIGRLTVDSFKSNKRIRQFVVSARVKPYKYKQTETVVSVELPGGVKNVTLRNSRLPVCPVITCTDDNAEIIFNGNTYKLSAGSHKVLDIRLTEGDNEMTVSGTGQVSFTYQEGDL